MIVVKKWFSVRSTVTSMSTAVTKVTTQLGGAISLLNTIRGVESANPSECQEDYTIPWYGIMILMIYEVIILIAICLVVRLIKHVHRLCNFNNLQMPDSYIKQNCCPVRMLGNRSDNICRDKFFNRC